MCGRYALGVRMAFVRQRLQDQGMPVDEAPEDDEVRETYNFAPGYYGAVYRGEVPDRSGSSQNNKPADDASEGGGDEQIEHLVAPGVGDDGQENITKYKLQKMRWGLIPFWTKRQPDYGSMLRTINCRADSLVENKGMWTSMKKKKRCVVVCQGFYEWLKKGPDGKEKIPHYTKRKDGDLMYFAGLWDSVQYEDTDEELYTYTIITTDSNPYLKFLHDRMPVILEPGSEKMKKWLDPHQTTWTKELQSILRPYEGDLECYPVSKEVSKAGNNSPNFIIPVNSKQNKSNIANFFANADAKKKSDAAIAESQDIQMKNEDESTENNAPKPVPQTKHDEQSPKGIKRQQDDNHHSLSAASKAVKKSEFRSPTAEREKTPSPSKAQATGGGRIKMRSATENKHKMSPTKSKTSKHTTTTPNNNSQKITDFFKK